MDAGLRVKAMFRWRWPPASTLAVGVTAFWGAGARPLPSFRLYLTTAPSRRASRSAAVLGSRFNRAEFARRGAGADKSRSAISWGPAEENDAPFLQKDERQKPFRPQFQKAMTLVWFRSCRAGTDDEKVTYDQRCS